MLQSQQEHGPGLMSSLGLPACGAGPMIRFTVYLASALIAFFHPAVPLAFSQEIDPRLRQILADWEKQRGAVQQVRFSFKSKTVSYALLCR
jgi:hypothetical protein